MKANEDIVEPWRDFSGPTFCL